MLVACEEHIDHAIEQFLEELEQPPALHRLDSATFTQWAVPKQCHFCSRKPVYLLT